MVTNCGAVVGVGVCTAGGGVDGATAAGSVVVGELSGGLTAGSGVVGGLTAGGVAVGGVMTVEGTVVAVIDGDTVGADGRFVLGAAPPTGKILSTGWISHAV